MRRRASTMSSRTTSSAQRSRASAWERRRIASSVRAEVKPNVAPSMSDSCRMRTYSSTMYSLTSCGTAGSNLRACEIIARMKGASSVSNSRGGCSS